MTIKGQGFIKGCLGGFNRKRWLGVAVVLLLVTLIAWHLLGHWWEQRSLPETAGVRAEVVSSLQKMWQRDHLSSHKTVMAYLLREMKSNPALFAPMETVVLAATQDRDFEARELAFAILSAQKHPDLARLAAEQLSDVDPAVRSLGLGYLKAAGTAPLPSAAITVATTASNGLAPNFELADVWNQKIRLADCKGKTVLLNFFNPEQPVELEHLLTLAKLQQKMADKLAVLGICVPVVPPHDCDKGHTPEMEKEHAEAQAKLCANLQQFARERGIHYPLLLDPHESVVNQFDGRASVISVWIDRQGRVRRRFIGPRTLETLEKMVQELDRVTETIPTK